MKELLDRFRLFFERVPDTMRRYRWFVWTAFIIVTVVIAMGAGRMKMDMSMDSFFRKNEPVKQAYDRFRMIFGSDEAVYIVYEPRDGDVFSEKSLAAIREFQEELLDLAIKAQTGEVSLLNHITEVKTIINVKYLETRGDALISRDFIGKNIPQSNAGRERLKKMALDQPDYPLLYFSENFKYGGILIKTDFGTILSDQETGSETGPEGSLDEEEEIDLDKTPAKTSATIFDEPAPEFKKTGLGEYSEFVKALDNILYQEKYTGQLIFHPVGNPIQMAFTYKAMAQEVMKIMLLLLVLILLTLWVSFRSFSGVLWPMAIIICTIVWIFGIIGWTGVVMSTMVEIMVFLVFAVGVADAVHIISGYIFFRRHGQTHENALRSVFRKSGLACFLTSVTTAAGLVSLVFVPIVPIQRFGIFAAISVLLAFVFTIFLLPLLLDIWSPVSKKRAERMAASNKPPLLQTILLKIESFSYSYPKIIISVFIIAGIIFLAGATQVHVDTNTIEALKKGTPLRQAYTLVDRVMGGTGSFEVLVDTGIMDGMQDPRVLNTIESFQNTIEMKEQGYIVKTVSLVNVTKDSYKALNEGKPEAYIIPQDPNVLAQTLFMFNNANPKDRRQMVTDDYRMGRVSVTTKNFGSRQGTILMREIEDHISAAFDPLKQEYPGLKVTVTGQIPLDNKFTSYISWSQITSFGLVLIVISIVLLLVLGSKKIGLIAIIPNVFPILTIFGLMGYLKVPLEMHLLLVAPITIGIAVDDTIHFLTHYRIEIQKHDDIRAAINATIREVGQAIVFTSLILSVGFLSYLFSVSKGFIYFGIFSGIAMATALITDLVLLPAMLTVFNCRFSRPPTAAHGGG